MTVKAKTLGRQAKAVLYCCLLLCLSGGLDAVQKALWTGFKHHVTFDVVSVEQGLSHSSVLCIMQDSDGFMWFGTEDGLNRYDGREFIVFHPDPAVSTAISNNIILSIYEDRAGRIWVGTNGGGLNLFDRQKGTFSGFRSDGDDSASISGNDVNGIFEDSKNQTWICTSNGLNVMKPPGEGRETPAFRAYFNEPENPDSLSNNDVSCIYEDKEGILWVGTSGGGLNRLQLTGPDGATPVFQRFTSKTHSRAIRGLILSWTSMKTATA